jgi:hypothetical protein
LRSALVEVAAVAGLRLLTQLPVTRLEELVVAAEPGSRSIIRRVTCLILFLSL